MKRFKSQNAYLPLALLLTGLVAGCNSGDGGSSTPVATDDTTAPSVILTAPADATATVALNSKIVATFSEEMTATTVNDTTFTVTGPTAVVEGEVTYADAVNTAIFTPTANLDPTIVYTANITTGAKDLAGNPLAADNDWTFTTITAEDVTLPTVATVLPVDTTGDVRTTQSITVTFSESMDPATITAANISFEPAVLGAFTYGGTAVTFAPASKLATSTTYTATINGQVLDLAGNSLAAPYIWSFTTAATDPENPQPPVLGEAGGFVILASQKITTTGSAASKLTGGDLGIMDQARSYFEGFTAGTNPGEFVELTGGLSYAHDDTDPALTAGYASTIAFLDQSRIDLKVAYEFLAADPNPGSATIVCPTQLGGLTLSSGVYKTAANVNLTDGPLHLDAQGDADAVFIFSIDGILTVGAPSGSIILDNGAQAKNVYFRTGGETSIEAGISFYGNVFAWKQVNVLDSSNVRGRLFSVNEQVTLISDTVTAPAL